MSETHESSPPPPDFESPPVGVARPVSWESIQAPPADPMLLPSLSRSGAMLDILVLLAAVVLTIGVETLIYYAAAAALDLPVSDSAIDGNGSPEHGKVSSAAGDDDTLSARDGDGVPSPEDGDAVKGSWRDVPPELVRLVLLPAMAARTLILTAAIFVITQARRLPLSSLGIVRRSLWSNTGIGLVLIMFLSLVMYAGIILLQFVWPGFVEQMQKNTELLKSMVPRMSPLAILGLMVLVAWWEELVFRGFLLTRLRRVTGSWVAAVLISGGTFSALHLLEQTGAALLAISVLALGFSVVTIWRRSLVPAITAHLLFNLSQFVLLYYVYFPATDEV